MVTTEPDFQQDIDDIAQIAIVPTLLDVICQTTGMRFAAIARVTEERWITCSVHDDILFGLKPGDELKVETTLCHEVRQSNQTIVIDDVSNDPVYCNHHTPATYGLQSYISVPIHRRDGSFFGTLCAIDPEPHILSSASIINMFHLYADLISFHLHAIEQIQTGKSKLIEEREIHKKNTGQQKEFAGALEQKVQERTAELEEKNNALEKLNTELESFAFLTSHDLQEPLRKIQTFVSVIEEKENQTISEDSQFYLQRISVAVSRMQSQLRALLDYSRFKLDKSRTEYIDLSAIVEDVKKELKEELKEKEVTIEVAGKNNTDVYGFQFRSLFYHLIDNSLKFSKPDQPLYIKIKSEIVDGSYFNNEQLSSGKKYCRISIADNGIGFDQQYSEHIFELFKRLNTRDNYEGNGIGLSIVKKIVDHHDGVITASGRVDEGAEFNIYIPVN